MNRTPSQPTISTGTEPELRIAVVSWLRVVAGRYQVTAWNLLYPVFLTLLKNMTEEAELFSPSWYPVMYWIRQNQSRRYIITPTGRPNVPDYAKPRG